MFLTQRQAAAFLGERIGIPRRAATRLLLAGLAGEPLRTPAALLYDRERVEAVLQRHPVPPVQQLPPECAGGVLLARTTDPVDPLAAALGPARFSIFTQALTRLLPRQGQGWYPLVVLVHHYVVAGGEILDIVRAPPDHPRVEQARSWPGRPDLWVLRVRPPGPWFTTAFADRPLPTDPGNPYLLWGLPEAPRADPPAATPRTNPPEAIC